jgi:hypothetical protein
LTFGTALVTNRAQSIRFRWTPTNFVLYQAACKVGGPKLEGWLALVTCSGAMRAGLRSLDEHLSMHLIVALTSGIGGVCHVLRRQSHARLRSCVMPSTSSVRRNLQSSEKVECGKSSHVRKCVVTRRFFTQIQVDQSTSRYNEPIARTSRSTLRTGMTHS